MESPQVRTALAWLDTFATLDGEVNIALRTQDCRHTMAPASMGYKSDMTNDQWATHLDTIKPLLSAFPVTAKEVLTSEGSNIVSVWATSEAIFKDEVKESDASVGWRYEGEYLFVFTMNAKGDRIERILEFIDSKKVAEIQVLMAKAKQNLAK